MEVTIVRFSRPILLVTDYKKDGYFYQTVYGFIFKDTMDETLYDNIDAYVGYLCALSAVSNGDKLFTISFERGIPDLVDNNGHIHTRQDYWLDTIGRKCKDKLNLSYELLSIDMEEDALTNHITDEGLIVSDYLYYDLERYMDGRIPHISSDSNESPLF